MVHALEVVSAAVERYAALTGGAYCGLSVERTQVRVAVLQLAGGGGRLRDWELLPLPTLPFLPSLFPRS